VQATVRCRLLASFVRRGRLERAAARTMHAWPHGGGFSVDASVCIEANDHAGRERLLRYCARPPFALGRLPALDRERLLYDGAKPGSGGSGPQRLTPLQLIEMRSLRTPSPHPHRTSSSISASPGSPGSQASARAAMARRKAACVGRGPTRPQSARPRCVAGAIGRESCLRTAQTVGLRRSLAGAWRLSPGGLT